MEDPLAQIGKVDIHIPAVIINSRNGAFDNYVESAGLFNVEKYFKMHFESTRFHFKNSKPAKVEGKLTLLGRPILLLSKAEHFNGHESMRLKAQVCGGDFMVMIDRGQ